MFSGCNIFLTLCSTSHAGWHVGLEPLLHLLLVHLLPGEYRHTVPASFSFPTPKCKCHDSEKFLDGSHNRGNSSFIVSQNKAIKAEGTSLGPRVLGFFLFCFGVFFLVLSVICGFRKWPSLVFFIYWSITNRPSDR